MQQENRCTWKTHKPCWSAKDVVRLREPSSWLILIQYSLGEKKLQALSRGSIGSAGRSGFKPQTAQPKPIHVYRMDAMLTVGKREIRYAVESQNEINFNKSLNHVRSSCQHLPAAYHGHHGTGPNPEALYRPVEEGIQVGLQGWCSKFPLSCLSFHEERGGEEVKRQRQITAWVATTDDATVLPAWHIAVTRGMVGGDT